MNPIKVDPILLPIYIINIFVFWFIHSFFCQIFEALNVHFVNKVQIHTGIQKLFERVSCNFFLTREGINVLFSIEVFFFTDGTTHSGWSSLFTLGSTIFQRSCRFSCSMFSFWTRFLISNGFNTKLFNHIPNNLRVIEF